jgi:hypothetical protein
MDWMIIARRLGLDRKGWCHDRREDFGTHTPTTFHLSPICFPKTVLLQVAPSFATSAESSDALKAALWQAGRRKLRDLLYKSEEQGRPLSVPSHSRSIVTPSHHFQPPEWQQDAFSQISVERCGSLLRVAT